MFDHRVADSAVAHEIKGGQSVLLGRCNTAEDLKSILIEKLKPTEVPEDHVQS